MDTPFLRSSRGELAEWVRPARAIAAVLGSSSNRVMGTLRIFFFVGFDFFFFFIIFVYKKKRRENYCQTS